MPGLYTRDTLEVYKIFCQVLDRVLGQVQAAVDFDSGEALVGQAGHVELFKTRHRLRREDLLYAIVCPTRPLPPSDVRHLEVLQVGRLGQEVGQVGEADSGKPEVLEVDEGNGVAIEEGDVCRVDVEDVVCRLFDVQTFQIRARVNEAREVEVVG